MAGDGKKDGRYKLAHCSEQWAHCEKGTKYTEQWKEQSCQMTQCEIKVNNSAGNTEILSI